MLTNIYYKLKNGAVISVDMNKISNASKGLLLRCTIENDLKCYQSQKCLRLENISNPVLIKRDYGLSKMIVQCLSKQLK